jgi:hypothetical protein
MSRSRDPDLYEQLEAGQHRGVNLMRCWGYDRRAMKTPCELPSVIGFPFLPENPMCTRCPSVPDFVSGVGFELPPSR